MAEIIKAAPAKVPGLNSPMPKLVKKESFAAMSEAAGILDAARMQARHILALAEEQRTQVLESARLEGEQDGLRGYLEHVAELDRRAADFYARAEAELLRLSIGIASKIVGVELKTAPEAVVPMVTQALATVRQARRIVIQVHPSQTKLLKANLQKLDLSATCDVQVVGDSTLEPGGCVIESELGIVDARLSTQLRVIERLLKRRSA